MIIDAHVHIGKRPGGKYFNLMAEDLIERMDKARVDKACALPWPEGGREGFLDNDYIANAAKRYPNRIIGFGCVSAWWRDAKEEIRRCVEDLGLKGIKLHPFVHGYPLDEHEIVDPIFELCAKYRVPIISHGMGDNPFTMPIQFGEMAKTFPEVKLIMAHAGYMFSVGQARRMIKKYENLYGDTTAIFTGDLREGIEMCGPEKWVLGTDGPYGDYEAQIKKVEMATSDITSRELILGRNMAAILGIK